VDSLVVSDGLDDGSLLGRWVVNVLGVKDTMVEVGERLGGSLAISDGAEVRDGLMIGASVCT